MSAIDLAAELFFAAVGPDDLSVSEMKTYIGALRIAARQENDA